MSDKKYLFWTKRSFRKHIIQIFCYCITI